jgi:ATP-dependent DNA ligase
MKLSTLYSRSVNGKINTFTIHIEGNKYYTVTGFLDGVKTQSLPTVCNAKTYCTAEEQAIKEATAIHRKKMESGSFENVSDIDNETFFEPMLAHKWGDYKDKVKYPIASQKKLDGVRALIKKDGMWSRNGKKIISAPHIFDSLKPIFEIYPNLVLDGELFALKESCDFNKIISCVKKTKPKNEDLIESKKYIQYWIYDCPSFNGVFSERILFLETLNLPKCCILVSTELANNEDEVMKLYKQYINDGFEGQMLRVLDSKYQNKRSSNLLKNKEFFDSEFIIKGVKEGIGNLSNKVGTLQFEINGNPFNSAVNGTHEYLEELWKQRDELIGQTATIKYFELTSDGIPRFPKVIQIGREKWE